VGGLRNRQRAQVRIHERFGAQAPIDIVFDLEDSGGMTEYRFRGRVRNRTGAVWSDFYGQLGTGTGSDFVPLELDLGTLELSGLNVKHGKWMRFNFAVEVPELLDLGGLTQFTLRQAPLPMPVISTITDPGAPLGGDSGDLPDSGSVFDSPPWLPDLDDPFPSDPPYTGYPPYDGDAGGPGLPDSDGNRMHPNPEPASLVLFGMGSAGLALWRRRWGLTRPDANP
jgi:hypothetical protein